MTEKRFDKEIDETIYPGMESLINDLVYDVGMSAETEEFGPLESVMRERFRDTLKRHLELLDEEDEEDDDYDRD